MATKSALGSDPFARRKQPAAPVEHAAPPAAPAARTARKPPSKPAPLAVRVQDVTGEIAPEPVPVVELPPPPPALGKAAVAPSLGGVRGLWSSLRMRGIADEVDGFGFDPVYFCLLYTSPSPRD